MREKRSYASLGEETRVGIADLGLSSPMICYALLSFFSPPSFAFLIGCIDKLRIVIRIIIFPFYLFPHFGFNEGFVASRPGVAQR